MQIYLRIRRHNIVNMSIFLKLIYRTNNESQSKSQKTFFLADKLILNFVKKMQNARIAKATLKKKRKSRGLTVKLSNQCSIDIKIYKWINGTK